MGILKNQPILFRIGYAVLVLIGFLVRTEVDGIAHIFRFRKNLSNDVSAPVIWVWKLRLVFPHPDAAFCPIDGRRFHLVVK